MIPARHIWLLFGLLCCSFASAAETVAAPEDYFVDEPAWVAPVFEYANQQLAAFPPIYPPSPGRIEALMVLDGPLHLEQANRFRSTARFLQDRMRSTIVEIEQTRVTTGAMIWKLYNMGVVVKTRNSIVGMDLVSGYTTTTGTSTERVGVAREWMKRLIAQLSMLSVSHVHRDHAEQAVAELALEENVVVVADDSVFKEMTSHPMLLRPDRSGINEVTKDDAEFPCAEEDPTSACIDVVTFPGHQAPATINNIYLFVTSDGINIMHTGDQDWSDDWEWIDRIHENHRVDILIINCWNRDLRRFIESVKPQLVVMAHENEMAHRILNREPWTESIRKIRAIPNQPSVVLCWGEGVSYPVPLDQAALAKENAERAASVARRSISP